MSFVNEKIPVEFFERIRGLIESRPVVSREPDSSRWTVDHDRNSFLVLVGKSGGGYCDVEEVDYYVLECFGEVVRFSASCCLSKIEGSDKYNLLWRILDCAIPEGLMNKSQEIVCLLRESLRAKGFLYDRDCIETVSFSFDFTAYGEL